MWLILALQEFVALRPRRGIRAPATASCLAALRGALPFGSLLYPPRALYPPSPTPTSPASASLLYASLTMRETGFLLIREKLTPGEKARWAPRFAVCQGISMSLFTSDAPEVLDGEEPTVIVLAPGTELRTGSHARFGDCYMELLVPGPASPRPSSEGTPLPASGRKLFVFATETKPAFDKWVKALRAGIMLGQLGLVGGAGVAAAVAGDEQEEAHHAAPALLTLQSAPPPPLQSPGRVPSPRAHGEHAGVASPLTGGGSASRAAPAASPATPGGEDKWIVSPRRMAGAGGLGPSAAEPASAAVRIASPAWRPGVASPLREAGALHPRTPPPPSGAAASSSSWPKSGAAPSVASPTPARLGELKGHGTPSGHMYAAAAAAAAAAGVGGGSAPAPVSSVSVPNLAAPPSPAQSVAVAAPAHDEAPAHEHPDDAAAEPEAEDGAGQLDGGEAVTTPRRSPSPARAGTASARIPLVGVPFPGHLVDYAGSYGASCTPSTLLMLLMDTVAAENAHPDFEATATVYHPMLAAVYATYSRGAAALKPEALAALLLDAGLMTAAGGAASPSSAAHYVGAGDVEAVYAQLLGLGPYSANRHEESGAQEQPQPQRQSALSYPQFVAALLMLAVLRGFRQQLARGGAPSTVTCAVPPGVEDGPVCRLRPLLYFHVAPVALLKKLTAAPKGLPGPMEQELVSAGALAEEAAVALPPACRLHNWVRQEVVAADDPSFAILEASFTSAADDEDDGGSSLGGGDDEDVFNVAAATARTPAVRRTRAAVAAAAAAAAAAKPRGASPALNGPPSLAHVAAGMLRYPWERAGGVALLQQQAGSKDAPLASPLSANTFSASTYKAAALAAAQEGGRGGPSTPGGTPRAGGVRRGAGAATPAAAAAAAAAVASAKKPGAKGTNALLSPVAVQVMVGAVGSASKAPKPATAGAASPVVGPAKTHVAPSAAPSPAWRDDLRMEPAPLTLVSPPLDPTRIGRTVLSDYLALAETTASPLPRHVRAALAAPGSGLLADGPGIQAAFFADRRPLFYLFDSYAARAYHQARPLRAGGPPAPLAAGVGATPAVAHAGLPLNAPRIAASPGGGARLGQELPLLAAMDATPRSAAAAGGLGSCTASGSSGGPVWAADFCAGLQEHNNSAGKARAALAAQGVGGGGGEEGDAELADAQDRASVGGGGFGARGTSPRRSGQGSPRKSYYHHPVPSAHVPVGGLLTDALFNTQHGAVAAPVAGALQPQGALTGGVVGRAATAAGGGVASSLQLQFADLVRLAVDLELVPCLVSHLELVQLCVELCGPAPSASAPAPLRTADLALTYPQFVELLARLAVVALYCRTPAAPVGRSALGIEAAVTSPGEAALLLLQWLDAKIDRYQLGRESRVAFVPAELRFAARAAVLLGAAQGASPARPRE